MSISSSSSALGSSSTTSARFFISRRKRFGISVTASTTRRSNCSRFIQGFVVIAVLPYRAAIAHRLRAADTAAMKNLDVRGERPHLLRQRRAELGFDLLRIVAG